MARHCHEMLMKVAKEFAGTFYEEAAHDDNFYHFYPNQKFFIERNWPRFVPHVRRTLVTMLGGNYPEPMKQDIYQALMLDRSIPASKRL